MRKTSNTRLKVFLSSAQRGNCGLGRTSREVIGLRRRLQRDLQKSGPFEVWRFEHLPAAASEPPDHRYLSAVDECDLALVVIGTKITDGVREEIEHALGHSKPLLFFVKRGPRRAEVMREVENIFARFAVDYNWLLFGRDPSEPRMPLYASWRNEEDLVAVVRLTMSETMVSYARRYSQAVASASLFPIGHFIDSRDSWSDEIAQQARMLVESGQDSAAKQLLHGTLSLASSSLWRASAHWLLGWNFLRTCAYPQALGSFMEARGILEATARDKSLDASTRKAAQAQAARVLGGVGIVHFRMGDAAKAEEAIERELLEAQHLDAGAGIFKGGLGVVGIERRPASVNLENLEQPLRTWLSDDDWSEFCALIDSEMDVSHASHVCNTMLVGDLSLVLPGISRLLDENKPVGLRWSNMADALFELSKWWLVPDWQKSFHLGLAAAYCYRKMTPTYSWGDANTFSSLGRALHRALKNEPDVPGLPAPVGRADQVVGLIRRLHSVAGDIRLALGNQAGLGVALRSRAAFDFDLAFSEGVRDPRPLTEELRQVRANHRTIGAAREEMIDGVLELRVRVHTSNWRFSSMPTRVDVEQICDQARVRGCLRLQAEVSHEHAGLLGRDSEWVKAGRRIFSEVLCEEPHATPIF